MSARAAMADSVDDQFDTWGVPAVLRAAVGAPPTPCLVVSGDRDMQESFGDAAVVVRTRTVQVRSSEATPAEGYLFELGDIRLKVMGRPMQRDAFRLVWTCQVMAV